MPCPSIHQYTSICFVLTGWLQSYSTHCVVVRGQLPYEPWRLSRELRGVKPSLSAVNVVSPETNELDGVAATARFTPEGATLVEFCANPSTGNKAAMLKQQRILIQAKIRGEC